MTRVTIDVNALSPTDSAAVDVVVPPPPSRRGVHLRWTVALLVAAAVLFGWLAGVVRPTVTTELNGGAASWSTDTGVVTFEFTLTNTGLSGAEVRGFEFDERWGDVTAAASLDGRPLPVVIPGGGDHAFRVTVQGRRLECSPPSAWSPEELDLDGSLLRADVEVPWLPFDHDVALAQLDSTADMALASICTGD